MNQIPSICPHTFTLVHFDPGGKQSADHLEVAIFAGTREGVLAVLHNSKQAGRPHEGD